MNDQPKEEQQKEENRPSIAELLADHALITAAIGRGVREALWTHARLGNPVCEWKDGKVVWVQPEEMLRRLDNIPNG